VAEAALAAVVWVVAADAQQLPASRQRTVRLPRLLRDAREQVAAVAVEEVAAAAQAAVQQPTS
jgi:hypothetical protein